MKKFLLKYASFLLALVVVIGYALLFRTAEVSGTSMVPTYNHQDLLLMWHSKAPTNGDIIAVYSDKLREVLCKRVIGVAGDHVVVDNENGLSVNGVVIEESYVSSQDWYIYSLPVDVIVPNNEVFVMGDNRVGSVDSRKIGCIPVYDIRGVVICNVTKTFGINRELLVMAATALIIGSTAVEVWKKRNSKAVK